MKAEQIDGDYDFFRCPKDSIASKALTSRDYPATARLSRPFWS
jgi:hypothetical protein